MIFIRLVKPSQPDTLGGAFCCSRTHQSPQRRSCCEHAVGNPQEYKTIHRELGFWWDSTEVCSWPSIHNNLKLRIKSLVIKLVDDKDLQSSQVQLVKKADQNSELLRTAKRKLISQNTQHMPVNGSALEVADWKARGRFLTQMSALGSLLLQTVKAILAL